MMFPVLVLRAGWIWVQIASVPDLCILFTFIFVSRLLMQLVLWQLCRVTAVKDSQYIIHHTDHIFLSIFFFHYFRTVRFFLEKRKLMIC